MVENKEQSGSSKDDDKPTPKVTTDTDSKPLPSTVVGSKAGSAAGTKRKSRGSLDIGKIFNKLNIL